MKRLVGIILVGTLLITIASCQSKPAPTPVPTAKPAVEATKPAPAAAPTAAVAAKPTAAPTTAPKPAANATVLRLAHGYPPSNIRQVGVEKLAQLLEQKTNGQYKIEIFHSGMLVKDPEIAKAVSSGILDMGIVSSLRLQPLVKGWEVTLLAGLFDDLAHVIRFEDHPQGYKKLLRELEKVGIKGLTTFETVGDTGIFVNVPIKGMEELKGLRIMASSAMMNDFLKSAFGVLTITVPPEEANTAMQTGMVNGRFTGPVPGVSMNMQDEAKWHYFMPGMAYGTGAVFMNLDKWNKLPADVRKVLEDEILPETQKYARAKLGEIQADSINVMKKAGVTIVTMTDKERATVRERLAPVWAKWEPEMGKEYMDLARSLSGK